MNMAPWLDIAKTFIGQREIPGPKSNGWIRDLWASLRGGAWFWKTYGEDDSKLPWCGAFCAHCMQAAGIAYPQNYASAKAWADWGVPCGFEVGAVVVLTRDGGGHVGMLSAISPDRKLVRVIGGNQDDSVSAAWFDARTVAQGGRILALRKPKGATLVPLQTAPAGALSRSEA
jgi:uncharacterized protein (TIGR02594 family)